MTAMQSAATLPHPVILVSLPVPTTFSQTRETESGVTVPVHHLRCYSFEEGACSLRLESGAHSVLVIIAAIRPLSTL